MEIGLLSSDFGVQVRRAAQAREITPNQFNSMSIFINASATNNTIPDFS
jgi:hypothetical protein